MNCCDEYGECNQGRNCPIRKQMVDARLMKDEKPLTSWMSDGGLGMVIMLSSSLFMSSMIAWGIYWLLHR